MSTLAALPVILVSAKSEAAAAHIISELIDNEPSDTNSAEGGGGGDRVWRIVNKYYTADVRLVPLADGAPPPDPHTIEGHVIYLAEDECTGEAAEAGERRAGAGARARVRVLAAEAARLPRGVAAWAARRRLEPVALRAPPAPPEPRGLPAARAALHAHAWPGLRRHPPAPPPPADGDSAGSPPVVGEEEEEDEEVGAVERAEQWAAALGALEGVRSLSGAERRVAAEALVAAFCRALGDDIDAL